MADPPLRGERVTLRPLRPADREPLRAILAEPAVARWWGSGRPNDAIDELFESDDVVALAIELQGELIGSIQYAEEDDPDYRHAGIDIFIATGHQGRGHGRDALRALARHLFDERGHHRLTVDPAAANERAIRTYRAVGFRPVGVMRAYERGTDGSWHDGLLLDLLAGELEPAENPPTGR
jgi:aminoglycoside 6'-N-acetyltransferase